MFDFWCFVFGVWVVVCCLLCFASGVDTTVVVGVVGVGVGGGVVVGVTVYVDFAVGVAVCVCGWCLMGCYLCLMCSF